VIRPQLPAGVDEAEKSDSSQKFHRCSVSRTLTCACADWLAL